jgi:hypothetical protein
MGDTARYIEAPEVWNGEGAAVFLAGGITSCPDWQQEARQTFRNLDVTVLNPRRADFPIGDPTAAPAQIAWEFDHLHRATAILFWFPASEGPQPIALYELGRYLALGRPLAVGCDPAYPRRQDVIEQLGLAAPDVPVWGNLSATCLAAVASAYRAGQAATPDGPRELVSRLSKRIADLRAEAGEEFCTCESYDCHGECCGIGNCTCMPAADGQDGDGLGH